MIYLGDFQLGQTVYVPWATYNGAGASADPSVAGTIRVYEAGNSTELATPGVTDTRGFDSVTGVHVAAIAATGPNGYQAGKDYHVVLVGAEIDGQTVNSLLATFSIENRRGLSAQGVRDAMKLAPSAGTPAAGSIDQELDLLTSTPHPEITAIPPAVTDPITMIRAIYALLFNRNEQTNTLRTLKNRAGTATIGAQAVSDDGTTAIKQSWS